DVLPVLPGDEERIRGDDAVVAEAEEPGGVDLEVEVRRPAVRVARVPDEADDVTRLDARALHGERRVRGAVRVVELVALAIAEPQAVAPEVVPADRVDGPVRDGQDRRPLRREDVLAVVPAARDVGPRSAERVPERDRSVDGEDVPLAGERRVDV